jgi:hypothetical protein
VTVQVVSWSPPEGGKNYVGFDDEHFGFEEMQNEIDFMREAHPNLPDKVPGERTSCSPGRARDTFRPGTR